MHEDRKRTFSTCVSARELMDELAQNYHPNLISRYFATTDHAKLVTPEAWQRLDDALARYQLTSTSSWPEVDRTALLPHFDIGIPPDFNIMACLLIAGQWQHDCLITNSKVFVDQHLIYIHRWYFDYDLITWHFRVNPDEAEKMIAYHAKEALAS